MSERDALLDLFDYQQWAVRRWLDVDAVPVADLLEHIVTSQEVWFQRCHGDSVVGPKEGDLASRLEKATASWKTYLEFADLDAEITYANFRGETFTNRLGDIARHVVNHGTYHRGQLRGRCEAAGTEAFPETDFIGWARRGRREAP